MRHVLERVRGQNINYVKLRGLVSRFMTLNPEADPEAIDWTAVYDDSLSYDELVEAFEREYPMYRWREQAIADERQVEEMVVNHVLAQVEDLSEEALRSLLKALEERVQVARGDAVTDEQEKPAEVKRPQATQTEPKTLPKITLRLLAKYPFLQEARKVVSGIGFNQLPEEIVNRGRDRLLEALERGELGVIPRLDNPWKELLSFPVSKAIASTIADNWLMRRWALAESARVERLLHSEDTATFEFIVGRLLNVQKDDDEYMIRFTDYLRLAQDLTRELSWKLVNQKLSRGWVYLTRTRLTRLLRQYLYQELVKSFETTPKLAKPPEKIAQAMAEVVEKLQTIKAGWKAVKPSGKMPPCMNAIMERLADAGHTENFVYAAYLVNTGYSIEEIVDVFRKRADFDERIARYQIEHIAGLKGSRIKYRPPSCQRMRELGLCIKNGELCPRNIRNPLDY